MTAFNPNHHRTRIERYLGGTPGAPVRLEVEVAGQARSFVLRPTLRGRSPAAIIQKKLALSSTLCYTILDLERWWM